MRVYIPTTLASLRALRDTATLGGPGLCAHAVTGAVREWYIEGDLEELEFAAMTEAAEASLRLLALDVDAPRRRVVLAADVPDGAVSPGGAFRSSVLVGVPLGLDLLASVHVDAEEAREAVAAAVAALPAADAGDDDAQFLLDETEAHDLLWYDVTELDQLV